MTHLWHGTGYMGNSFFSVMQKWPSRLGGFITLRDLTDKGFDPLAYRYLLLTAHYRSQLNFSEESLQAAQNALQHIREEVSSYPSPSDVDGEFERKFHLAINDDLDMPHALRIAHEVVKSDLLDAVKHATLLRFDEVLGLGFAAVSRGLTDEAQQLLDQRQEARDAGDYAASDRLRDELAALGVVVEDTAEGQKVKQRSTKSDVRSQTLERSSDA